MFDTFPLCFPHLFLFHIFLFLRFFSIFYVGVCSIHFDMCHFPCSLHFFLYVVVESCSKLNISSPNCSTNFSIRGRCNKYSQYRTAKIAAAHFHTHIPFFLCVKVALVPIFPPKSPWSQKFWVKCQYSLCSLAWTKIKVGQPSGPST